MESDRGVGWLQDSQRSSGIKRYNYITPVYFPVGTTSKDSHIHDCESGRQDYMDQGRYKSKLDLLLGVFKRYAYPRLRAASLFANYRETENSNYTAYFCSLRPHPRLNQCRVHVLDFSFSQSLLWLGGIVDVMGTMDDGTKMGIRLTVSLPKVKLK